jgi:hypothetical protein
MGLQNMQILVGATITATGGTAKSFVPDNQFVQGGVHVVDSSESDFRVRESITYKAKSPAIKGDGTYTKETRSAKFVKPWLDANGVIQYDTCESFISLAAGSPNRSLLRTNGAQLFVDADTDAFYNIGSLT